MSPPLPFVACRIREDLPHDVAGLDDRLSAGVRAPQAELAGKLITDASCDLVDEFFGTLLEQIAKEHPHAAGVAEARSVLDDVKGNLRHYLGWVTSFFGNERIAPVVKHYRSLMTTLPVQNEHRAHLAFALSPGLASEAVQSLDTLRTGGPEDARAGVEVLIRVLDEALVPLLFIPKERMKFNFVVNKTLDGVISVTKALVRKKLRKLGEHLPREHYGTVTDHLAKFLHVQAA